MVCICFYLFDCIIIIIVIKVINLGGVIGAEFGLHPLWLNSVDWIYLYHSTCSNLCRVLLYDLCMASSDKLYRSIVTFFKFFSKGWGPIETYERLVAIIDTIIVIYYKILLPSLSKTLSFPKLDRSICRQIVTDHSHTVTTKKVLMHSLHITPSRCVVW